MFVVTDASNHIVCKNRSLQVLIKQLAVTYPAVSMMIQGANVKAPEGLRLTYVS